MPIVSIGDMSQQFVSLRNGGAIKMELGELSQRMSSGQVTDVTAHLGGDTGRFSGIRHSLSLLDGYSQAAKETTLTLDVMQTALSKVNTLRDDTSAQLLLISNASNALQINETARSARSAFGDMVATLNTRLADRSLMGGTEVDGPALADAEDMLADLTAFIGAATTTADISAAIETWFDDPAGGFATMGYTGDPGTFPQKRVSESATITIDVRADDPALRDVLKAAAFAAVADEIAGIDLATKGALLQESGMRLFAASSGVVAVQSRVGFAQAAVENVTTELNAQRTALSIAQNDLISADPFETASRLQSVQLQLETHYAVTARMSQLSLLEYL